jgi:hypothetical protein
MKNTSKGISVRYMIKFLCHVLNSLQNFNDGTTSSMTYRITFASRAGVTTGAASRVRPPSSGNAMSNDGK